MKLWKKTRQFPSLIVMIFGQAAVFHNSTLYYIYSSKCQEKSDCYIRLWGWIPLSFFLKSGISAPLLLKSSKTHIFFIVWVYKCAHEFKYSIFIHVNKTILLSNYVSCTKIKTKWITNNFRNKTALATNVWFSLI